MPQDPTLPTSRDADGPPERSRRLLIALVVLGTVSVVIAAVVIASSGGSTTRAEDPEAELRAGGESLIVGNPDAPTKVVVFEDFGDPHSRDFEIASRDFLQVEAAQGDVLVEYRPFPLTDGYSLLAIEAWAAVLEGGTATQAMAFHDELFDRRPDAGAAAPEAAELEARRSAGAAGIETVPTVLIDGEPFGTGPGVELADRLQRRILAD